MPDVFVNYRSGDGDQAAATIEEALSHRFGTDRIYRASKSIAPGEPFDSDLIRGVRRSGVLLALIGPGWAEHPALGKDSDWVSREIQEAFLCDIRVIPVLIGRRTERPVRDDLPRPLQKLADCQSLRYDDRNKEYDLKQLGDWLARLVPELAEADREPPLTPEPGAGTHNTAGDVRGSSVQTGTFSGGVVHIGPSKRSVRMGDGGNYVEGDNSGGIHQTFRRDRRQEGDGR
ncbi:TIR domain-containing protein [Streptomyces sp. TLI_55]|uniref:toll/interleukin-1 receptor domain-containing protein n=1 Tax=Streptomyces sp. TLI_55 TaxID=1938861 RepID=UPI000BD73E46|nr:toll/interleukin-1 receptor domain-containing protein [Streptomyces sp. TLI_55]SNX57020.1 TIR domain-containing protein [Streptomyces sp. TLI_55]